MVERRHALPFMRDALLCCEKRADIESARTSVIHGQRPRPRPRVSGNKTPKLGVSTIKIPHDKNQSTVTAKIRATERPFGPKTKAVSSDRTPKCLVIFPKPFTLQLQKRKIPFLTTNFHMYTVNGPGHGRCCLLPNFIERCIKRP